MPNDCRRAAASTTPLCDAGAATSSRSAERAGSRLTWCDSTTVTPALVFPGAGRGHRASAQEGQEGAGERLARTPGRLARGGFVAQPGVSQQQLAGDLRRALPQGTEAVTGAAITKETQDSFQKGLSFFTDFLLIFAVVALVVGGFITLNTFAI